MKFIFWICAALSLADACAAFLSLEEFGDMHWSWGWNSVIAAGVFINWAREAGSNHGE